MVVASDGNHGVVVRVDVHDGVDVWVGLRAEYAYSIVKWLRDVNDEIFGIERGCSDDAFDVIDRIAGVCSSVEELWN